MTPAEIEVLLHCYYSPEPHPRISAPGIQQTIRILVSNGLLVDIGGDIYKATSRGCAHVEQLCQLPWPTMAWIGADGKVIEAEKSPCMRG